MATKEEEDKRLIEEGLAALSEKDAENAREAAERKRIFEELAARIEQPGLQDKILERYQAVGRTLLSDTLPRRVDPHIARALRPHLGDVSDVRVHTGKVASEAAAAMHGGRAAARARDRAHARRGDRLRAVALARLVLGRAREVRARHRVQVRA